MKPITKLLKRRVKSTIMIFSTVLSVGGMAPSALAHGNRDNSAANSNNLGMFPVHESVGKNLSLGADMLRDPPASESGKQVLNQEQFWATHPGMARHIHATPALVSDPATRTTA